MSDQNETQSQETEAPKITMADISKALQVIDASVSRGAFQGSEITMVGQVRDNLASFIEYHRTDDEPTTEEAPKPE